MEPIEKTLKCLHCDGYNYQCPSYATLQKLQEKCVYYHVMDNDLRNIYKQEHTLTFGHLEKIIKGEK